MKPTIKTDKYELWHGKAEDIMPQLPQGCANAVIADPPYGTTACAWDTVIPFDVMWSGIKHVAKERAAIALFGSEPFSSTLRLSNVDNFSYDWIWDKRKPGNIFLAKQQPMKVHEIVSIFNGDCKNYTPQMEPRSQLKVSKNYGTGEALGGNKEPECTLYEYTHKYPKSIIDVSNANQTGKLHPTEKPVPLLEYLIKTYTNESETVLDFTFGSGTTGVAAIKNNRYFVGIESDEKYFAIAAKRLADCASQGMLEFTQ